MTRIARVCAIACGIAALLVIAAACSSSPSGANPPADGATVKAPSQGLAQSNSAGSVTIEMQWLQAGNGGITFEVGMNTHSVDLDSFDLGKLAVMRDDQGKEYRPTSWSAAAGGHHRSGSLTFPVPASVAQGKAQYVQVVIRDVVVQERVLTWRF